ncbi:UNVERIFIED_ORG: hypothetical protein M2438_004052 [Methylobacterium sp. SuP10 SLI 274]|nr:hypothetical protein [Methylobacterium sp. SuP10 SLI 274]
MSVVIATARMPGGKIADMKPLPALTRRSRRIGSLAEKPVRMIAPTESSSPFGAARRSISPGEIACSGQAIQRRSSGLRV